MAEVLFLQQLALQGKKSLSIPSRAHPGTVLLQILPVSESALSQAPVTPYLQPACDSLGDRAPPLDSPLRASYCHSELLQLSCDLEDGSHMLEKTEGRDPGNFKEQTKERLTAYLLLVLVKVKRLSPCM